MNLFTSNYARHAKDPNAVCISVKAPRWFKGKCYFPLAPTWELVSAYKKGEIDETEYTIQYLKLLKERNLDANQVVNDLGDNAIMLCYESPTDFCHRHIAAAWIMQRTGIEIHEKFLLEQSQQSRDVERFFKDE